MTFKAAQDIKVGAEISINYCEEKCNEDILFMYGFVEADPSKDVVRDMVLHYEFDEDDVVVTDYFSTPT